MPSRSSGRLVVDFLEVVWPVPVLSALYVATTALPAGSAVRLLVVLAALLTLPGYAVTLVAFPLTRVEERTVIWPGRPDGDWSLAGLGPLERWVVALGFSISLVPVYGLLMSFFDLPYDIVPALAVVVGTTSAFTLAAFARRVSLPEYGLERTPGLPGSGGVANDLGTLITRSRFSNVVVVLTFVIAAGSLGAAITVPAEDPTYTTASLLTENETGQLVAAGYPHDLRPGEDARIVFALENHEGETTDYRVVVQSQRVAPDGTVTQRVQSGQFTATVGANETWERSHRLSSDMPGDRVRVAYLVYRETPPDEPTIDNAYRSLTLWIREPMPEASTPAQASTSGVNDSRLGSAVAGFTPSANAMVAGGSDAATESTPQANVHSATIN